MRVLNTFLLLAFLVVSGAVLAQELAANAKKDALAIDPPTLIKKKAPRYPKDARKAKVEGTVKLGLVIGKDGHPKDVTVIEGNPLFTDAAKTAVLEWRYKPASRNGETLESNATVNVDFFLDGHHPQSGSAAPPLDASFYSQSDPELREGAFRPGNGVVAPHLISGRDPEYTEEARKSRVQGQVVLWMVVTEQGTTRDFKITQGLSPELDARVIEVVSKWKFSPATKDGQPVAALIDVKFYFTLH